MKTIMRGLTLAAVLLTGTVTQAEIVIDNFIDAGHVAGNGGATSTGPLAIGNGVLRTLSVDTSSATFGVDGVGSSTIILNAVGSWAQVAYDLTGFSGGRNFFVDQVLRLGFVNSFNPTGIQTDFTVTATGATTGLGRQINAAMPTQFSMTGIISGGGPGDNGHLAALANVDILTVRFTRTTAGPSGGFAPSIFGSTTGVLAVPEPATMSLLGLTAIGGIFAHRRRKNQLAA